MAIKIGANFAYNGKLPNFERDSFETKAAMKAFDENSIDEGHLSYCKEDGNIYQYKSANSTDTTTGRWRLFKTKADAALNGTSTNAIQNKAVFDALKLKADAVALDKYQPKYKADYIAKQDLIELPITEGVIDLNGHILFMPNIESNGTLIICNGSIMFNKNVQLNISSFILTNISILLSSTSVNITLSIYDYCEMTNVYGAEVDSINISQDSNINELYMYNSIISIGLPVNTVLSCYNSNTKISKFPNNDIIIYAFNSTILYDGVINSLNTDSKWYNSYIKSIPFISGYVNESGEIVNLTIYEDTITNNSTNAPQTKVVYNALQLKADKTQLNNYVTTATANSTYAKKSDITNIYKFKGTKTNYADLPTTNRVTGDVWNITTADAEHGIKAGDNVAWNGTEWDNLSGTVDLSAYATTTTTDAISADVKKLMDKAFPFTVKVSIDKALAKKGTSQPVKVTITPKIGDDNTEVDAIMINGAEHHGAIPYVYSTTATTTTTYNVRADKTGRNSAHGSATITFVNPSYDGVVAANFTATEANIKALTETLRSGKGGTRTFNLNNQKACIAYPKAFGAATGIKDVNGFDYLASYTRSELNVNGELYYVYLLTNATTITDMKQTIS